MLLTDASPTTVKSPPIDKSVPTNKRLFILTSIKKLGVSLLDDTSPSIAAAGIEASGTFKVPFTTKLVIFAVAIVAVFALESVQSTVAAATFAAIKVPVGAVAWPFPRNKMPSLPILAFSALFAKKPI